MFYTLRKYLAGKISYLSLWHNPPVISGYHADIKAPVMFPVHAVTDKATLKTSFQMGTAFSYRRAGDTELAGGFGKTTLICNGSKMDDDFK